MNELSVLKVKYSLEKSIFPQIDEWAGGFNNTHLTVELKEWTAQLFPAVADMYLDGFQVLKGKQCVSCLRGIQALN